MATETLANQMACHSEEGAMNSTTTWGADKSKVLMVKGALELTFGE